jgi:hypothetical protein
VCDWAALLEESADQLIAARRLREEIDDEADEDRRVSLAEDVQEGISVSAQPLPGTDVAKAETDQPSAQARPVINLSEHRARRRGNDQYPVTRQYSVNMEIREGGIIGFSFDGVGLSVENIDQVRDDLQFVADRLRDDRSDFLGEPP